MTKIFRYFIQGIIITVPVAITLIIVYKVIAWVGSLFTMFGIIINPVIDPFIIIFTAVLLIFLMGLLGSSIILRPLFSLFDNILEHTPFIKTVYSSIKDLLSAFVGSKKRFNKPVLITINKENNIQQLGFITQEDLSELNITKGTVAVYVPLSYSFSGNLLIVPADHITVVNASSSEVMKFIVSGGVTDIDEKE
ncbi:MAG: rane protein [Bacteroidetes bacterium]|nr:rane protein [Bacteroidota bacterium]